MRDDRGEVSGTAGMVCPAGGVPRVTVGRDPCVPPPTSLSFQASARRGASALGVHTGVGIRPSEKRDGLPRRCAPSSPASGSRISLPAGSSGSSSCRRAALRSFSGSSTVSMVYPLLVALSFRAGDQCHRRGNPYPQARGTDCRVAARREASALGVLLAMTARRCRADGTSRTPSPTGGSTHLPRRAGPMCPAARCVLTPAGHAGPALHGDSALCRWADRVVRPYRAGCRGCRPLRYFFRRKY